MLTDTSILKIAIFRSNKTIASELIKHNREKKENATRRNKRMNVLRESIVSNYRNVLAFGFIGLSVVSPPTAAALFAYSECASRKASTMHTIKSVTSTFILCGILCMMLWLPGIAYTWSMIFANDKSRFIPYWSNDQFLNLYGRYAVLTNTKSNNSNNNSSSSSKKKEKMPAQNDNKQSTRA